MKTLSISIAILTLTGCASLYVQPPLAGNSIVHFVKDVEEGVLSHEPSIQAYLNARDCSDRMRVTPSDWADMNTDKGIVLLADREFAVSLEAIRSIKFDGLTVERNSCKTVVSFTPQANQEYRLKYIVKRDGCALQAMRLVRNGASVSEIPDVTARKRQWVDQIAGTGASCKAE